MNTYEVVLFENKDRTEKYVQVWWPGSDYPEYRIYIYEYFLFFKVFSCHIKYFKEEVDKFFELIEQAKRIDTEKFPDLDKIKQYNEANNITPVQVIKQPPVRP